MVTLGLVHFQALPYSQYWDLSSWCQTFSSWECFPCTLCYHPALAHTASLWIVPWVQYLVFIFLRIATEVLVFCFLVLFVLWWFDFFFFLADVWKVSDLGPFVTYQWNWCGVTEPGWGTKAEVNSLFGCHCQIIPTWSSFKSKDFKSLFLLQLSILILGFDIFPLGSNPCFSNPLPTLLSLRGDPTLFFPFSSWTDICHIAQSFYPHADHLFRFLSIGYPQTVPSFHYPPKLNGKLFLTCYWFLQGLFWPVTLNSLQTCSRCNPSAPCPAQVGGPVLPAAVYLAIAVCVTFNKSWNLSGITVI